MILNQQIDLSTLTVRRKRRSRRTVRPEPPEQLAGKPNGTRAEREAWMRARMQRKRQAA